MKTGGYALVFWLILAALVSAGCGKELRTYTKWSRNGDLNQRDSAAFYFYEKKNYEKAAYLLEELMSLRRSDQRAEEYLYTYAWCKFKQATYISAAYQFEQFIRRFPSSKYTEECAYMVAYSYYKQSDPYYLDQSFTKKAISQFQIFADLYPGSLRLEEANRYIDEMRERLAHKNFEQSKLYLKVEDYRAAVESFRVFVREYPDSRYREESQYLTIKAALLLADMSTQTKKKNRYLDAVEFYEQFIDRYPNSVFRRDAESLYVKAKRSLGKIAAADATS